MQNEKEHHHANKNLTYSGSTELVPADQLRSKHSNLPKTDNGFEELKPVSDFHIT